MSELSQQGLQGCSASPRLEDVAPSTSDTGQAERDSSLGAQGGGKSIGSSASPLGWKMLFQADLAVNWLRPHCFKEKLAQEAAVYKACWLKHT